jgi:hypothetical protein
MQHDERTGFDSPEDLCLERIAAPDLDASPPGPIGLHDEHAPAFRVAKQRARGHPQRVDGLPDDDASLEPVAVAERRGRGVEVSDDVDALLLDA